MTSSKNSHLDATSPFTFQRWRCLMMGMVMGVAGSMGCSSSDEGGSEPSGPPLELGEPRSGEGTYYDADGSGACMLDAHASPLYVAALNAPDWAGSALCGACAAVNGPQGSVTVRIVDLCPGCATGDLDFSREAFVQLAPLERGRIPIDWVLVSCDVSGPIRYRYKDGVNAWWTAVQVRNHRLPIASMEWSKDGVEFQPMVRTDYNYFLAEDGFGPDPVRVRVTAVDGQTLEDELPAVQELLEVSGSSQFR